MENNKEVILVVDDHEINRYTTRRFLENAGFDTVEASCGQEALEKAREVPALILLDVNLPDIDGFQVCKTLRSDPTTTDIPIVHTSATFVSDDDRITGLETGADGYLTRPIEPRVLIATIRSCLRARKAEAGLRQRERELQSMTDELKEANGKMNEFIATLAHELRNPLAPIRTGLEVIRLTDGCPDPVPATCEMMQRQTQQMIRLIDDLLDMSRITQGKLQLKQVVVSLRDVLESAVDAIQPSIDEAGHKLDWQVEEPPIKVTGDPNRLTQVFANILSNASKYTNGQGKISLVAYREGTEAVISIKDNGLGIPLEMQTKIFEMFAQIDRPIELGYTGLGIGLTLVKRIVELHSGNVIVKSDGDGKGSEFIVRLPLVSESKHKTEPVQPNIATANSKRKVLVVDDNRDAAKVLSIVLKVLGNEVFVAHNGVDAVKSAQEFGPSVILMDIGMPILNGYEAAKRIRKEPWGIEMVLVALTGWGQAEDKQRTVDAGFDYHLTKPAEPAQIQQLLNEIALSHLERKKS